MAGKPVSAQSFLARVRYSAEGCWEWSGSLNTHGYGQVRIGGKQELVTRVSYRWAFGNIPAGLWVLHKCDNPACVRPDHLFLGDVRDNVRDMIKKGRKAVGEKSGTAKLTNESVLRIRAARNGGRTYASIGAEFGITPENASYICNNKTWRHV